MLQIGATPSGVHSGGMNLTVVLTVMLEFAGKVKSSVSHLKSGVVTILMSEQLMVPVY
ncbi:hypothetical protein JCM19298_2842 [Nonlabens ulvanivorans]|nr:hypothetical protein [Nonlabens ulvanivorans]GAK92354.1 hypothetical protein JCM19298_2842 [Nonlabens ulvanivorans]